MQVVYKYKLEHDKPVCIPRDAKVLHAELQRGEPCIWVQLDPNAETIERHFFTVVTGEVFDETWAQHVGTCMNPDRSFVLHVFEVFDARHS